MSKFRLADSVSARLVQIFQEAVLTGVDGADLLRQVRLNVDESEPDVLVLSQEYRQQVKESHEKLLKEAEILRQRRFLVGDRSD